MRRFFWILALVASLTAGGCGDGSGPSSPISPSPPPATLVLAGDPESSQGATWTYRGTIGGLTFDLQGVLLKPLGPGPFPAVIISHGAGGNAAGYSRSVAADMMQWGLVGIATNYTHAGGVPVGAPGGLDQPGASAANVQRAHAMLGILQSLGYVDMNRIAAHGHSLGAFVTTALVAAHPASFRAASHTAGGVRPGAIGGELAVPVESQAQGIRAPYQLHHGDADFLVPIVFDQRLATLLQGNGIPSELHVYAGVQHNDIARNATMLSRVRGWYAAHGMF